MNQTIKRVLTLPLLVLAALLILFEDFVWDKVTALVAILARWRLVARLERWVLRRGRHATLALFAVPIACLIPIKLVAVYLIASGHVITGILVIVAAKLTGTAVSARLFVIAKPKLMTFETFVAVYRRVLRFKDWAHGVLDRLQVRQAVHRIKAALRRVRARMPESRGSALIFLDTRWRAVRRRLRRSS